MIAVWKGPIPNMMLLSSVVDCGRVAPHLPGVSGLKVSVVFSVLALFPSAAAMHLFLGSLLLIAVVAILASVDGSNGSGLTHLRPWIIGIAAF